MFDRTSIVGMLAATALALPTNDRPSFHLEATGAVNLAIASGESSYGVSPEKVNESPILTISMGATAGNASLMLFTQGRELPKPGRYPVLSYWPDQLDNTGRMFHACFIAGTPDHPVGGFHGESGVVTITKVEGGRISGDFQLRARGILAADTADENQWVTVRGSFVADGDSTAARLQTLSSRH